MNKYLPDFQRAHLVSLAIIMLFVGLLFNRVVHSIGIFFACVYIVNTKDWIKKLFADGYLISFLSLSVVILVFDLINAPQTIAKSTFLPKLALLVYPLLISLWNPGPREVKMVFYGLFVAILLNICYGFFHLVVDYETIIDGYKRAKVMPTLALGDHIRMSWVTVMGIWGAFWLLENNDSRPLRNFLFIFVILSVIYLHVLSAKTGLIVLYASIGIYTLYLIKERQYRKVLIGMFCLLVTPFIAFKALPSLQNRVAYIIWDISGYWQGNRQVGLSDGSRIASIKAGWNLGKTHLAAGVGSTQLKQETYEWYQQNEPQMKQVDYIMPSSQFLIFFATCGISGLIVFFIHLTLPFFQLGLHEGKYFYILYLPSAFTFLYETHLEGQYAIFIYGFFTYLFFHVCKGAHLGALGVKKSTNPMLSKD